MQHTLTRHLKTLNHYLDVIGVSEFLGLAQETIYRLCREGILPHLKVGKSLRFDPRQLALWIQKQEFPIEGCVSERITSWVREHVLDKTLCLPIPESIIHIIAKLPPNWRTNAKAVLCDEDATKLITLLGAFQAKLEANLSLEEQRDLLAELFHVEALYA
jgi:excisionase family DNA binding protein